MLPQRNHHRWRAVKVSGEVIDSQTGNRLGALRRRGVSSLLRDNWEILDATDQGIGSVTEDSMTLALLRRFLTNLIPQRYRIEIHGQPVGSVRQHFNPFVHRFAVDFARDHGRMLPRALGIATVILLLAIEGRQG